MGSTGLWARLAGSHRIVILMAMMVVLVSSCADTDMTIRERIYCQGEEVVEVEVSSPLLVNIEPAINDEKYIKVVGNEYIVDKVGVRLDDSGRLHVWLDEGIVSGDTYISVKIQANHLLRLKASQKAEVVINSPSLAETATILEAESGGQLRVVGLKYQVDALSVKLSDVSVCSFINDVAVTGSLDVECTGKSYFSMLRLDNDGQTSLSFTGQSIGRIQAGCDNNRTAVQKLVVTQESLYEAATYKTSQIDCRLSSAMAYVYLSDRIIGVLENKSKFYCFSDEGSRLDRSGLQIALGALFVPMWSTYSLISKLR